GARTFVARPRRYRGTGIDRAARLRPQRALRARDCRVRGGAWRGRAGAFYRHERRTPHRHRSMSNGLLARLKSGLARSSRNLTEGIAGVLTKRKLDDAALDALEETLIVADLGTRLAAQVVERLRQERFGKEATDADIRTVLADEIARTLAPAEAPLAI